MAVKGLNRRDFLKLLGLSSLLIARSPVKNTTGIRKSSDSLPNILVVLFDALSARHMSLYGYPRQTTPNLERLAERADVFHRHYAGGNYTPPGTASLLTGVYPWSHRAFNIGGVSKKYQERNIFSLLKAKYNTFVFTHNPLVQRLLFQFRNDIHDYHNMADLAVKSHSFADRYFPNDFTAVHNGEILAFRRKANPSSAFFLSRIDRLARYYTEESLGKTYNETFPLCVPGVTADERPDFMFYTLEQAVDGIQEQIAVQPRPFMGYVHLYPPHYPYCSRKEFSGHFYDDWQPIPKPKHHYSENHSQEYLNTFRQAYDEFILYLDAEFARLYDYLDRNNILDNTYLIFTSDHGEMFERGIWAHTTPTLYEELVHIPLVVWGPGNKRRRDILAPTSCVDLLPTLLQLADEPIPSWSQGFALPMMGQEPPAERDVFVVEAKGQPMYAPLRSATLALIRGRHKLIYYKGYQDYPEKYELYDLEADPEELEDLSAIEMRTAQEMRAELIQELASADFR